MYDEPQTNRVATLALFLAFACASMFVASGPLYRTQRIGLTTAFLVLRWAFVAVRALRVGAANPIEYGGAEIAAEQHRGYPDIAPVLLTVPPDQAFDRALRSARSMGWDVVASDPAAGRIEATDTTFWFGFTDDIAIRVTPAPGGSRVDLRSVSRVGLSDVGTNAARIRKFTASLK
jgi:uncharacterized protein (DUF1499 family)